MERTLIPSGSPYEKTIGFSRAVRIGNLIAVSGTAPIADGKAAFVGDAYEQTKLCLSIIQTAIEEAGGSLNSTVRTRVFLTDKNSWEDVARAHGEYFGDIRPASTFVVVKELLSPEWLVEVEADCVVE